VAHARSPFLSTSKLHVRQLTMISTCVSQGSDVIETQPYRTADASRKTVPPEQHHPMGITPRQAACQVSRSTARNNADSSPWSPATRVQVTTIATGRRLPCFGCHRSTAADTADARQLVDNTQTPSSTVCACTSTSSVPGAECHQPQSRPSRRSARTRRLRRR